MRGILKFQIIIFFVIQFVSCTGQKNSASNSLSNDFENDPPIYYAMPEKIDEEDHSPAWKLNAQKLLIRGTVYQNDGKTPAPNVLIYYYQTNPEGRYLHNEDEPRRRTARVNIESTPRDREYTRQ